MREIRLSGLEGGGAAMSALPTPIRTGMNVPGVGRHLQGVIPIGIGKGQHG